MTYDNAHVPWSSVAPVRERGLKCYHPLAAWQSKGRSREGAWIEIAVTAEEFTGQQVAPVRERGLKYHRQSLLHTS